MKEHLMKVLLEEMPYTLAFFVMSLVLLAQPEYSMEAS